MVAQRKAPQARLLAELAGKARLAGQARTIEQTREIDGVQIVDLHDCTRQHTSLPELYKILADEFLALTCECNYWAKQLAAAGKYAYDVDETPKAQLLRRAEEAEARLTELEKERDRANHAAAEMREFSRQVQRHEDRKLSELDQENRRLTQINIDLTAQIETMTEQLVETGQVEALTAQVCLLEADLKRERELREAAQLGASRLAHHHAEMAEMLREARATVAEAQPSHISPTSFSGGSHVAPTSDSDTGGMDTSTTSDQAHQIADLQQAQGQLKAARREIRALKASQSGNHWIELSRRDRTIEKQAALIRDIKGKQSERAEEKIRTLYQVSVQAAEKRAEKAEEKLQLAQMQIAELEAQPSRVSPSSPAFSRVSPCFAVADPSATRVSPASADYTSEMDETEIAELRADLALKTARIEELEGQLEVLTSQGEQAGADQQVEALQAHIAEVEQAHAMACRIAEEEHTSWQTILNENTELREKIGELEEKEELASTARQPDPLRLAQDLISHQQADLARLVCHSCTIKDQEILQLEARAETDAALLHRHYTFFAWMKDLWKNDKIESARKVAEVALKLWHIYGHQDQHGYATVVIEQLAKSCGMSRQTGARMLHESVNSGAHSEIIDFEEATVRDKRRQRTRKIEKRIYKLAPTSLLNTPTELGKADGKAKQGGSLPRCRRCGAEGTPLRIYHTICPDCGYEDINETDEVRAIRDHFEMHPHGGDDFTQDQTPAPVILAEPQATEASDQGGEIRDDEIDPDLEAARKLLEKMVAAGVTLRYNEAGDMLVGGAAQGWSDRRVDAICQQLTALSREVRAWYDAYPALMPALPVPAEPAQPAPPAVQSPPDPPVQITQAELLPDTSRNTRMSA